MRTAATILIALLLSAVRAPASPRAAAAIPGIAAESAETAAASADMAAAGADVAIMAESGGETFAAAALTDAAGFLCYARARGCTFADSAVVFTAAYMHWTREDDPAGGFRLRDSAGRYLAVGGSDDATCMTALSAGRPDEPFTISHGAIAVAHQGDTLLLVLLSHRSGRRSTLAFGFIPAASYDASRYSRTYLAPLLSDISAERTAEHYRQLGSIRVATKYPRIARAHFARRGTQVEIVQLHGNIELGPLTGMSECIVDITATGTTLRENNLVITDEVLSSTARFFANVASLRTDARVRDLAERLREQSADCALKVTAGGEGK